MRSALGALLLGALLVCPAIVGAQTYPPNRSDLEVSTSEVEGGGSVLLRADGFRPRTDVTIALRPVAALSDAAAVVEVLDVVPADARGAIETTVEIPADTPPGEAILEARGPAAGGGVRVVSAVIDVVAAESAPGERAEPSAARETSTRPALTIAMILAGALALAATGLAVRHASRKRDDSQ